MDDRHSPLSDAHEAAGASFTDFGGWQMPVEFDSIRVEHEAVRESVGRFDVSHMGQVTVAGPDATALCQHLLTNDVTALEPGQAQYAAITDEGGIMLDDTVVYRLPATDRAGDRAGDLPGGDADYLFIPNAGHDGEMTARWTDHRDEWGLDATVTNRTDQYGMIAVQGPDAPDRIAAETETDLRELDRFAVTATTVAGVDALVARTGYTGEKGFEVVCPWAETATVWESLDVQRCGLGSRDTLRLEQGFLLSGQDFDPEDEPRTPYEAGIGFCVKLDTEFVGRDALEGVETEGPAEKLVGLILVDRGVPRHGYAVETPDGEHLGHVTSGTVSPTLGDPIALAYLPTASAEPDRRVRVSIRGEPKKARTTTPPFVS